MCDVRPGPRAVLARPESHALALGLGGRTRSLSHRLVQGGWGAALGGEPCGEKSRAGALHRNKLLS